MAIMTKVAQRAEPTLAGQVQAWHCTRQVRLPLTSANFQQLWLLLPAAATWKEPGAHLWTGTATLLMLTVR